MKNTNENSILAQHFLAGEAMAARRAAKSAQKDI